MITSIVASLHLILVVLFSLRILLREDLSPPARLAWFVLLVLVPYAGVVIYFLFGEIDLGRNASDRRRDILARLRDRTRAARKAAIADAPMIETAFRPAFTYAASVNGFRPTTGNTGVLLDDASATTHAIVQDIDNATTRVHVLYYIWLEDGTGTAIADALMRAAARGVTCRALADGLGSRSLIGSELWQRMGTAGVRLGVALPLDRPLHTVLTSRIDMRNHRKITVIDDRITYCGSQNAADPEFRIKAKYAPWIDVMIRLEGPIAWQNQLLFAADWMAATGEEFDMRGHSQASHPDGFVAQVMGDGPTVRRGATPQLFCSLVAAADAEITITTPYFVPDAALLEALCAAAWRGVIVTLVFPARNDSWVVAAASRSYYRRLLEAGCVIYEFNGGLLHAKTLTVDNMVSLLGSSNLDLRSFDLNYENNVLLQDRKLTRAIYQRQLDFVSQSTLLTIEDVLAWSKPRRIWQNAVATVGPVL